MDGKRKADDPCDATAPKRANSGDVTDRVDETQKADDPCDVTTPKRANPGDVTDRVDRTQKADDPCDVTASKRAKSGDVTDRVDQTQKADDPCDVTAPKRAKSGDVTDRVDRTQKADDPCDVTASKRAKSGDMTEGVVPSLLAPHGSRQSTSSVSNNYAVTGMAGGTAIRSVVAGVLNYQAAECTLLQHLIAETELKIRSRDPTKHVSTYAERDAFRHLRAFGSVIIRGRSGSGKSHLGYTLLERVKKSCQRIPVKISYPDEWNHIHKSSPPDAEKKYVVMVDDIFGQTNLIQSSFDTWRQKFDLVWPLVESGQIWLVMTSRPEIITQGEPEIFRYEVINKAKEIILDEGKYSLQEADKLEFLDKLCGNYIRQEDMEEIADMDTALGFPQCCTFFAANENARLKGVEFFMKPFEFIKDLIECVKKNQPEVYFVLLLVFMNEGQLSMKELKSVEHDDKFERQFKTITSCCMLKKARLKKAGIENVAQSVCGVYLLESSRCFLFSHRSIYDVLFVALCKDSPDLGIKMSTPVTLLEFIRISAWKLERCKMEHNVVCLDEDYYQTLADKLREYLSDEKSRYIVLSHSALQNTKFLFMIFQGWKDDDIYQLSRHNGEEVVEYIALPLSKKLGMPETVNILKYNLFLSHVIMNRMKEFASRIIESLSTYDSEDIQTVLNEALLCALYTCEKDLATTLLSHGAKPNMLCFSTLCNSPQLDADTSSSIISKVEGNETSLKLLLRIAVISCNKTVISVLIQKLNALSENHEQFYSHCLELLLKINGNGHEDIRQKTTNAGHEILKVMTLLEESGGKLDSRRISLASRHKDPSVLRSLLLRSRDGIHVTDEIGQTPLHLGCLFGGADGVELLLKHGAELSVDKDGSTPFHDALKSCVDQKEKLKLLLNKNSSNNENFVNLTNNRKCTALHYAARRLDSDCMKMLLEAKADTNVLDVHEQSPLFYALDKDIPEVEDMCYSNTPLHSSLLTEKENCHKVVQALLEKGSDAGIRNKKDKTPLHCAAWNQCKECVELLLPVSDVNAQDSYGNTALHCAVLDRTDRNSFLSHQPCCYEVVKALLDKAADAEIKNKKDETLLHRAAQNQCKECVELLLPKSDVNAQDSDGNTALHCALPDRIDPDDFQSDRPHCHEVVKALLEKGADVGIRNMEDETLLHRAAQNQCKECVDLLLPLLDVNAQDSDGNTALHCAVLDRAHHYSSQLHRPHCHEVVKALLDKKGAHVEIKNKKDETPLHYAAQNQCMECVDLLLAVSDINAQDSDGNTALHCAFFERTNRYSFPSYRPHCHEVVKILLAKGADVGIRNKKGETPLHRAAWGQCVECVKLLLPVLDVNAQDSDGNTALHCAFPDRTDPYSFLSYRPHWHEVVKILLAKGADVGIRNKKGETPLHRAAWGQCVECVKLLLPVLDVNAQDSDGNTALHCAFPDRTVPYSFPSYRPHCHEVVKVLLTKGADAGIRNKKGETPLHRAAWNQCKECVDLLLPVSDVNAQDSDGNTALHMGYLSDDPHCHEITQALLAKGADVGIRNKKDKTPLHCAARKQCVECVKQFLPVLDVNAQDSDGNTALHCAVPDRPKTYIFPSYRPHCHEVVKVLLEKGADAGIRNKKDETPLHRAAWGQCVECVKQFLPVLDVNAQDSDGNTALHCAFPDRTDHYSIQSHRPRCHEVVKVLLAKGADVGIRNKKGETLLHRAAWGQCVECVKQFLPVLDVNAQDSDGNTALHCAFPDRTDHYSIQSHRPRCHEVVKVLLAKGADVGIRNKKGETLLHRAAWGQCVECVKQFLPVLDVNAQDSDGNTALHCAFPDRTVPYSFPSYRPRCHEVVKVLLAKGADVGIRNKKGETLLHRAAWGQCVECVKLLLPVLDVNAQDSDGNTALHCAFPDRTDHYSIQLHRPRCHEVVKVLLAKGADVGIRNKKDETLLHRAAWGQCVECVKLLLPVLDVNAQDSDGNTALHCAFPDRTDPYSFQSRRPHCHEVVKVLLAKGADVGIRNKKGETLLHRAALGQCVGCVKLLLPGSDVNAQDSDGNTALHCAVLDRTNPDDFKSHRPHCHEVVKVLLEKGADVGIRNMEDETPLHYTARKQCKECVELLSK